jgi:hypothetical protein
VTEYQPVVVVVRLNSGDDVLAIIHGESQGKVKLEHPHYIRFNPERGTVAMVPYCLLSDEKYYQIPMSQVHFVVTANQQISDKFIKMINGSDNIEFDDDDVFEDQQDVIETSITGKLLISGNNTKH